MVMDAMATSTLPPRACAFATVALVNGQSSDSRPRALTSARTAVPVLLAAPPPPAASATSRVHGRRAVLRAAALSTLGALIGSAHAADGDAKTDSPSSGSGAGAGLDDEQSKLTARASARPTVSLAAFYTMVDRGEVSRVWFIGAANETCLFTTTAAGDDDVRRVGEGYPVETSSTQESPLAVAAYLRDRYVWPSYLADTERRTRAPPNCFVVHSPR
jgi:hypothetical protein